MLTDVEKGMLIAVSILLACHDMPSLAAEVVRECGLSNADVSALDDYDRRNLGKITEERGISLKGTLQRGVDA